MKNNLVFVCLAALLAVGCGDDGSAGGTGGDGVTAGGQDAAGGVGAGDVGAGDVGAGDVGADGTAAGGQDAGSGGDTTRGGGPSDVTTTPDAAGTEPGKPLAPDTLRTAYVSATSYSFGDIFSSSVIAGFYDQTPVPLTKTEETVGPCTVEVVDFGGQDGGFPQYASAGTITFSGGSEVISLTHGPGGYGSFSTGDAALFTGGEMLVIAGSGGSDVPAFQASLTAPAHVTVDAPVYFAGQKLEPDKDSDLAFEWSGASAGEIEVTLAGPQQLPEPQTVVRCYFDAAAGAGAVPAAALGKVVLSGTGTASVRVVTRTTVETPGWGPVRIRASMPALKTSGAQWQPSVVWP